jgi:molecular chaperone DnaK (HSP70)
VTKSEVFSTHVDNQPRVQIDVYQGESYDPEQNNLLGTFFVEDLASVARGNEIIVQFKIDLNGMLTTTATEKRTGNAKTITFDTSGQHRINLDAARSNLAELLGTDSEDGEVYDHDEEEGEEQDSAAILSSAKSLRRRADALLKKGLNESDTATIQKQLEDSTTAIQAKDWPSLSKLNDSLSDLLFYLDD